MINKFLYNLVEETIACYGYKLFFIHKLSCNWKIETVGKAVKCLGLKHIQV